MLFQSVNIYRKHEHESRGFYPLWGFYPVTFRQWNHLHWSMNTWRPLFPAVGDLLVFFREALSVLVSKSTESRPPSLSRGDLDLGELSAASTPLLFPTTTELLSSSIIRVCVGWNFSSFLIATCATGLQAERFVGVIDRDSTHTCTHTMNNVSWSRLFFE